jgi:NDP-sugar pyrophosphorylase family protein
MVLAAGFGTRMRPLTERVPKPLLPLVCQPLLASVLWQLRRAGVEEVVVNLHHQAAQLAQWLGDGRQWDLRVHQSYEPEILGTAGAMKRAAALLHEAPFIMLNADVVIDIDLAAVWRWHCEHDARVTMVVRPDPAARQYGAVIVDATDRIRCINGRPSADVFGEETVFTGVQVVSPQVLDRIPPDCHVSTTAETYPALIAQGEPIRAYRHTGYWMDVGVPERYLQAHWDILDAQREATWLQEIPPGTRIIHTPAEARAVGVARLVPPVVLGPEVRLAPSAHIGPYAVLGKGCRVAAGAEVRESVLWEGVSVGANARVYRTIVADAFHIPTASVWDNAVCQV